MRAGLLKFARRRPAAQTNDPHAGSESGLDPDGTVFDNEASVGRDAHFLGSVKEEIGEGLGPLDIAGGKDLALA